MHLDGYNRAKEQSVAEKIEKSKVVGLAYTLTTPDGEILEVVKTEDPMFYMHGHGQLLSGVETVLENQGEGFKTHLRLNVEDAFGPVIDELVVNLPRAHFPEDADVEVGMAFNTLGPDGQDIIVEVIKVEGDEVTVDGNHPLAGLDLEYNLEVVEVRQATEKELEQGYVFAEAAGDPTKLH